MVQDTACNVTVAHTQVGVKEQGGNNRGLKVEQYLASTRTSKGQPWCSSFQHWAFRKCGNVFEPAPEFAAAKRWHTPDHIIWKRGTWAPDTAKSFHRVSRDGMLFALWYNDLNRIGHVGMIIDEDEDFVYTIEGNTSTPGSRDGDGVYARKRLKSSLYCISDWQVTVPPPPEYE